MKLDVFLGKYGARISQDSEKLFLNDFIFPLIGEKGLEYLEPQKPFIDSTGKSRKIDFAVVKDDFRLALEVNGETYHAEGIIPNDMFDDNLFRQNEIIRNGWLLLRFSYNQLLDSSFRPMVMGMMRDTIWRHKPELLGEYSIKPNPIQKSALEALGLYRKERGWKKGIVVLPTGTGKTFLSAFDSKRFGGKTLFIVHRLDILKQSKDAFEMVWPTAKHGLLTGDAEECVETADVLFASKDTLRQPGTLSRFSSTHFRYIVIDEVHHSQAPSYKPILEYFEPEFLLGMTATPDRLDRKDIFELFDYNKVFEVTLSEAIEQGYLVPYTYYGLYDNVDYSKIRWNGYRYSVTDLERNLIIKERNEKIYQEYIEKGGSNKAIGFCVSIKHAESMAKLFNSYGIPSIAATSESPDRDQIIKDFRDNKYFVIFTVDLFNEGMDIPNARTLMFLRPTESKTVFLQQLGRGLRKFFSKDRVVVLDFIGNYKRAGQIRKFLAKHISIESSGKRAGKPLYEYTPNCEIKFDAKVEEILDKQEIEEFGPSDQDLIEAYYEVAEKLKRKPSIADINEHGKFKIAHYLKAFDSWIKFLRRMGEYTEASYHYPQGVHLGHMLYILKIIKSKTRKDTLLDDKYLKIRGNLSDGRLGAIQRQTKYKLQGLMEMGLILDERKMENGDYIPTLTAKGEEVYSILEDLIKHTKLDFTEKESWDMKIDADEFNKYIWENISKNQKAKTTLAKIFLEMPAASQMLNFLYRFVRAKECEKKFIYTNFFRWPPVKQFCEQNGIEEATEEGAKHRCPFLLNILESLGFVSQTRSNVIINTFVVSKETMTTDHENENLVMEIIKKIEGWVNKEKVVWSDEEISLLRELFGKDMLTQGFYLSDYTIIH